MIIVVAYIFIAFVGPYIVPVRFVGTFQHNLPPSLDHLAGTDYIGRDLFGFLVHGASEVLILSSLTALMTTLVAVIIGTVAGMSEGKIDAFLTFMTDVMLTIPGFPLLIVLTMIVRRSPSIFILAFVLALVSWPSRARALRSQVLTLKQRDFVEASRSVGFGTFRIIFFDILPALVPYIVITTMRAMINAIYSLVGLSLLGALPYNETNWGIIINTAVNRASALMIPKARHAMVAPLLGIVVLQVSIIMLSYSFEIIFNPRLREKTIRKESEKEMVAAPKDSPRTGERENDSQHKEP